MKKFGLWIGLVLIFLVVLNLSMVLLVKNHTPVFWLSVGFIHFAYLVFVLTILVLPTLLPGRKDAVVLGLPITYLAFLYFIFELLLGLAMIIFKNGGTTVSFLLQLLLAGIFGFIIVGNLLFNENIKSASQKDDRDIFFIKNAVADLKLLQASVFDNELKTNIDKLSETLRFSQVNSSPALAGLESTIMQKIEDLKQNVSAYDNSYANQLVDEIGRLVNERNSKIRLIT